MYSSTSSSAWTFAKSSADFKNKVSVIVILLRCTDRVVIKNSNAGCVDEKLNVLTPHQLLHQEIPFSVSHVTTQDGQQIPYGLHILLESMKKQYIKMVQQMQSREYKENIETQIARQLVLMRLARLLVNVFWIARTIVPVKLHASLLLKTTTPNALVRFVQLITTF